MKKIILAISPHSDDIELGCAGYLARMRAEGHEVHICLVITQDVKSYDGRTINAWERENELKESAKLLDVTSSVIMIPDREQSFDLCSYPKSDTVKFFDKMIKAVKANEVIIPVPSFHQEHQYVYECGIAATRPTKGNEINRVLAYTYPGGSWGPSASLDQSKGAVYVNITDYMDLKLEAIKCHKSQMLENPEALISLEGVTALNRLWGQESGFKYAEKLYLLKEIVS